MDHGVLTEGGSPDEVENRLPVDREPRFSVVQHDSAVGVYPKEITHIALLRFAVPTVLALPGKHGKNMVARLEIGYALPNTLHDPK